MNQPVKSSRAVTKDPHADLRQVTAARIALGRCGGSLPTSEVLDFRLQHALARDAVHQPLRVAELAEKIAALGPSPLLLRTCVKSRDEFLRRPDLGRQLDDDSVSSLATVADNLESPPELVIIASDGLSSSAVHAQLVPLLTELLPRLSGWSLAPTFLVPFARVALQDPIGERLGANLALMLLGERPGLRTFDSLGAYFTFQPREGATDADRNCISNIRPAGLGHAAAAETIVYLLERARDEKRSGIQLKDDRQTGTLDAERAAGTTALQLPSDPDTGR